VCTCTCVGTHLCTPEFYAFLVVVQKRTFVQVSITFPVLMHLQTYPALCASSLACVH
jgi:hypothetical protein